MMLLKWICFILVCLDVVGYIIEKTDMIRNEIKSSSKISRLIGMLLGITARVYILYGAATCWLLV